MANIIRSAKSASRWTASDLAAYNIQVVEVNVQTFFIIPGVPAPTQVITVCQNLKAGFSAFWSPLW